MRKGIAVPTILKLVIGVIVVVIVVFLIYRYVLKSPIGEQECRARMAAWCASCQLAGWSGGTKLDECANTHWGYSYSDCKDAETVCAGFLPSTE